MTRLFVFGLSLGFAGILCAGHFYPWVAYERLPSQTRVVANGGRAESFLIRLPADRIGAVGSEDGALHSLASVLTDQPPVLLEHFKLRSLEGNVIGLAARHWTESPQGPAVTWSLVIPGRGAVAMSAAAAGPAAIDAALAKGGRVPGQSWTGTLTVTPVPEPQGTQTIAATAEFDDLNLTFTESWSLTGVTETGELRGTIELATVARRGT